MNSEIKLFDQILSIRNRLKAIQQLSWELSQLDKRYPLEEVTPDKYQDLIAAYVVRLNEARKVLSELDERKESV